ncbi:DUF4102 domain-containing protein [Bradyrhizobium canariense]|uniref:tyrosine-type recombinase/integrase n=1 Tax=Bradyrhizobium canariense TaxID=255045 RepID=UPI001CA517E3|nr:site-specific integrase [Bradyrhizobium canariense]MBW5434562.1 DUF4102 domain-containing protein [Bradyrhizobium canariense]
MALNSSQVKSKQPGAHADGGGLYLIVRDTGERVWGFRFTAPDGKRAMMEFGAVGDKPGELTLTAARDQAREYRLALKKDGADPRHKKQLAAKGDMTLETYWKAKAAEWLRGRSGQNEEVLAWARSLRDVSKLHDKKLHEIDATHVLEALKPIWWEKPVSAGRTRERLERVLSAAKVEKHRTGENPAAWRDNLKHLLPSPRKLNRKKGHASVNYERAPALMAALAYDPYPVARCVEVGILCCSRSQEIRRMEWDELDLTKRTWLVPAEKMKIKGEVDPKPHLVPLSDPAIKIIQSMPNVGRYVFPSNHADGHQPFRANALVGAIKRAGFAATMHGMRTTFRNWGADDRDHNFRREVLEFCLSHRVGDEAELSYWTSEMLDRRREVLEAWADFILPRKADKPPVKRPNLRVVA